MKLDITYAGYEAVSDKEENVVKECFLKGILNLCFASNYDVNRLYNIGGLEQLEELFSSEELKEMKKFLAKGRDNISSPIEKFPD
jgi:hypothetical protein